MPTTSSTTQSPDSTSPAIAKPRPPCPCLALFSPRPQTTLIRTPPRRPKTSETIARRRRRRVVARWRCLIGRRWRGVGALEWLAVRSLRLFAVLRRIARRHRHPLTVASVFERRPSLILRPRDADQRAVAGCLLF